MRKYLYCVVIVSMILPAVVVQAQQENSKWINAVTGLNSSWIIYQNAYGNPEIEYSTTFGFTGGMGMTYFISNQWGVNASLLATKMGQNYSGVQSGGDAERKVKLNYVEIPLLIMRHISNAPNPTWVALGPDIMILTKAQQEYFRKGGEELTNPDGMKSGDIRERFNPTDVALNFSVNKMYELNDTDKVMFLFTINGAFGLTDINSIEWKIPQRDGTYTGSHNFYLGVKVGLMFKASRDK